MLGTSPPANERGRILAVRTAMCRLLVAGAMWPAGAGAVDAAADERVGVMQALMRSASAAVPRQQLHCDVNGSQVARGGQTINNKVTVGDFVAAYVAWSLNPASNAVHELQCEGQPVQTCTLMFGQSKSLEGWSTSLRFNHDPRTKRIDPKSLSCIDVP